jgi:MoxR-like ATPase
VPADIIGTRIYNQREGEFQVSLGPVFANLLLADEINRAPAKVQSALLEVMQERQVTIAGETHKVPSPFLVMATQNPIETEGTYPLPEAQVDRFMMKVLVDYPTDEEEFVIVQRVTGAAVDVVPVASPELLAANPLNDPADLVRHVLLHDGSPDADDSCPDWAMWLAARGIKNVDGNRGPRFNQSSLVIEAAVNGRGVALAKQTLAQADLEAGRLVAPLQIATAVDFAYYVVHPKAKGRLPQVKAFVAWLQQESAAHEAALRTMDNGAGI